MVNTLFVFLSKSHTIICINQSILSNPIQTHKWLLPYHTFCVLLTIHNALQTLKYIAITWLFGEVLKPHGQHWVNLFQLIVYLKP